MNLTILQVGETPVRMRDRYQRFEPLFETMFARAGAGFTFQSVFIVDGAPFPDPAALDGVIITGSAAGVYDDTPWMVPLRSFIRDAYAHATPMLGICFGHQIMADALGGDVRKSDKGWGLGRRSYLLDDRPDYFAHLPGEVVIAASHQDQVITSPDTARVFMRSDFTPNAGLVYDNGAAISMQPHPEFGHDYTEGLIELRRNNPLTDTEVDALKKDLAGPFDNIEVAKGLARFFAAARP